MVFYISEGMAGLYSPFPLQGATHCLADLCDVLHCDWFSTAAAESSRSGRRRRPPPKAPSSMMRDAHCMPHEAQRTRTACQELANA